MCCKNKDPLRAAFEWIPQEKRLLYRFKKKLLDEVEKDLRRLGVENWKVYDTDKCRYIVVAKYLRK